MATGLFQKLYTQAQGVLHDTVDKNSDPGVTARQLIRDLEGKIATAESGLVDAMGNEKLLEGRRDAAQAEYDKYDAYARKALAKGDEALAKDALTERQKAESTLSAYKLEVDHFSPTVDALKAQVEALRAKKDEMERQGELLDAQNKAAQAQDKVATAISGVGSTNSIDSAFKELQNRTAQTQAKAQAKAEIAGLHAPAEDKFKSLDVDAPSSVDDALEAMKRDMAAK